MEDLAGEDSDVSDREVETACGKSPVLKGFVTGHDFSRAANAAYEYGLYRLRKNP
jgi:hypothetical protein